MNARYLSLVRHAKSSWRFRHLDDFRRPLNKRGLRDCARMPKLLTRRIPKPDLMISSDAVRAVQTTQALADAFELFDERIVLDPEIYLADVKTLMRRIRSVRDSTNHVMLVGHNPGLTELCNHLLPAPVADLPTLAVAVLRVECASWTGLTRGGAKLEKLLQPKDMLKEPSR